MKKIPIIIDNKIRIPLNYLNKEIQVFIEEALRIPNPQFINAKKEQLDTTCINKYIYNYTYTDNCLVIPRGFGSSIKEGLMSFGIEPDWQDKRVVNKIDIDIDSYLQLRSHQKEPVDKLILSQQGMYEAPPAAGKTVICLEIFRRLKQKTLILVDKKNIAEQWRERAEQHLGIDAGLIGDNTYEDKHLTIALVQTLSLFNNKFTTSQTKKFYSKWGMVIVDECHHAAAPTWRTTLESFPAKYRFGVSATPDRENGMFDISELVLGPIVHKTTKEELYENKTIMKPILKAVSTDFKHVYFPTHKSIDCEFKPECKGKYKVHRNNYSKILTEICKDRDRANLIVDNIINELNKNHIVISKRINHLNLIKSLLAPYTNKIHMLIGEKTTEERSEIIDIAMNNKIIILSTLADEALDIPTLDVIHLAWPTRSVPLLRQQIGRVQRSSHGKDNPVVFDYVDRLVPPLNSQWHRRRNHYLNSLYKIEFIGDDWPGNGLATVL